MTEEERWAAARAETEAVLATAFTSEEGEQFRRYVIDEFPCGYCGSPAGTPCVTISGNLYDEQHHVPRRRMGHAVYEQIMEERRALLMA